MFYPLKYYMNEESITCHCYFESDPHNKITLTLQPTDTVCYLYDELMKRYNLKRGDFVLYYKV